MDSTSPRGVEKACYYSGVCLEAGEVEAMEIAGNSNAETSTAFLRQLREKHPGPLVVIWDNGPAHRGEAIRSYLTTPDFKTFAAAMSPGKLLENWLSLEGALLAGSSRSSTEARSSLFWRPPNGNRGRRWRGCYPVCGYTETPPSVTRSPNPKSGGSLLGT